MPARSPPPAADVTCPRERRLLVVCRPDDEVEAQCQDVLSADGGQWFLRLQFSAQWASLFPRPDSAHLGELGGERWKGAEDIALSFLRLALPKMGRGSEHSVPVYRR